MIQNSLILMKALHKRIWELVKVYLRLYRQVRKDNNLNFLKKLKMFLILFQSMIREIQIWLKTIRIVMLITGIHIYLVLFKNWRLIWKKRRLTILFLITIINCWKLIQYSGQDLITWVNYKNIRQVNLQCQLFLLQMNTQEIQN